MAQFIHNSWPHKVTKQSPFELLIGTNPRTISATTTQKVPALEEQRERLEKMRWMAQKAMLHAQVLMRQSKKKATFAPYQKNQKVWLEVTNLKTTHPSAKLAPRQYGPFTVKMVISPVIYQLDLPKHWKIHDVFHTSLLSPYKEMTLHGPNYEEPPPDLIDDQPEWEVEAILDLRHFGCTKTLQYQVQWKGYSLAHNSWEPATNVHAPDLVKQYYKNKGKMAVQSITPTRIHCLHTMSSPSHVSLESTPSYIQELNQQFAAQPLPDFQLMDAPIGEHSYPSEPLSPPTPPLMQVECDMHPSLLQCIEQEIANTPVDDAHPGIGWEESIEASHQHQVMINNPATNLLHEAKYMRFMISKETEEPEIWGTDGIGKDIVGAPLRAEPCFANVTLGIDDTDLSLLTNIHMFRQDVESQLWAMNDYGVIADVYRLHHEPILWRELEKRHTMKNRVYDLALALQADYTKELQDFLKSQQDVQR